MGEHRFDELLWLGDLMDFDFISKFNKEAPRLKEDKRFLEDYKIANKFLDRQQAIIRKNNKKARFTLLQGNHDFRPETYVDSHPEQEGNVEPEFKLRLGERGIKWVRSWAEGEMHKIGKAYFIHGLYTNQYHAKKTVDSFGVNTYYGHTHDIMSMPKTLLGKDKTLEGGSLGCLCDYDQKYMKGKPNNWQQSFSVMYTDIETGFYNLYTVRIFNHTFFSPDGKFYK